MARGVYSRKKVQQHVLRQLRARDSYLLKRLKQEWEESEKQVRHEERVRRVRQKMKVGADVLLTLAAVGGTLVAIAAAPGLIGIMGAIGVMRKHGYFLPAGSFRAAKDYCKRHKYITVQRTGANKYEIELTKKGEERVLRHAFKTFAIHRSEPWDGEWRVVIFDIPEKRKSLREAFREKLRELGFYRLQESVFVMPYPCEEEIWFLAGVFGAVPYIRIVKTRDLSEDKELLETFSLRT